MLGPHTHAGCETIVAVDRHAYFFPLPGTRSSGTYALTHAHCLSCHLFTFSWKLYNAPFAIRLGGNPKRLVRCSFHLGHDLLLSLEWEHRDSILHKGALTTILRFFEVVKKLLLPSSTAGNSYIIASLDGLKH